MADRLMLVLGLVLAAASVSCGDDDEENESATEAAESQAADGRRDGGEITVAMLALEAIDPRVPGAIFTDGAVHRMAWRGLYSLDPQNNVVSEANMIAAGLPEVSPDGKTVTVRMNEGLSWSDGNELRAEDFVAGIIRSCNPVVASVLQYQLANIVGCDDFAQADPATADLDALQVAVGVRAIDGLTLEFSLQEPQPTFPIVLTLEPAFPVPVHLERFAAATAESPGEWGSDAGALVYNGPYVIESWEPDRQLVLGINEHWQGSVKPTLDRIVMRFFDMADLTPVLDSFRNGEVQVMTMNGTLSDAENIGTGVDEFTDSHLKYPFPFTHAIWMQLSDDTLSNLEVRLALSRAIDREALNREVLGDINEPTTSWIPPNTSGVAAGAYEEVIGFEADAAREHLAAAGYANGEGFPPLSIIVGEERPQDVATAEFLKASFKEHLDIDLNVDLVDEDTRRRLVEAGQFQMLLTGWITDYPDPEGWMLGLFETGGMIGCSDPQIDALLGEAAGGALEGRRPVYAEAESIVIGTLCGVIPYFQDAFHYLVDDRLVGLLENVSDSDRYLPGELLPEAWGFRAE